MLINFNNILNIRKAIFREKATPVICETPIFATLVYQR